MTSKEREEIERIAAEVDQEAEQAIEAVDGRAARLTAAKAGEARNTHGRLKRISGALRALASE